MKIITVQELYKKHAELREEDVRALQEWMKKQPYLPTVTDSQMALFLHSCYYSMELSKATIENYYTYRTHLPEFFANRNPKTWKALQATMDTTMFVQLSKPTADGNTVWFFKFKNPDADCYMFTETVKLFDMSTMQWTHQHGPSEGVILVVDVKGTTISHLLRTPIPLLKKAVLFSENALPIRLKQIHLINVEFDTLIDFLKPFLSKKLTEMVHFYNDNLDKLYQHVPKECLPSDYGGTDDSTSVLQEKMISRLNQSAKFFEDDEKLVADESKRLGECKKGNDLFGTEGSFKKLDID